MPQVLRDCKAGGDSGDGGFRVTTQPLAKDRMQAIYALPDHEVVGALIPATSQFVPIDDALSRIAETPGMVPVAIDHTGGGHVLWADLGDHPFREWQYLFTVKHLAENGLVGEAFRTDFDILKHDRVVNGGIQPRGLVFHISRCGSTLVAKALARSESHVVITQGSPLQRGFWATLTDDWRKPLEVSDDALHMFRNLVLAMTRPRRPEQNTAFVKFISWNVLYADFIAAAYPDVPALFLYRDPVEVIASVMNETTAVLHAKGTREAEFLTGHAIDETTAMGDVAYLAECYARYFETVGGSSLEKLSWLNYADLKAERFADIVARGLEFRPEESVLASMLEQFRFHSKDDSDSTTFKADSDDKRQAMAQEDQDVIREVCGESYRALNQAPRNLFPKE